MRKVLIGVILLLLCSSIVMGLDVKGTLGKANDLVNNKQYESAFKLLQEADPKNENPEIVALKVDILLEYFAMSTMHQMFALKDLKENETIGQIRGREGVYSYYKFAIDTVLEELIGKYPENGLLYKALGNFYFEVSLKYGDRWLKPEKELIELAKNKCLKAEELGVVDAKSLYTIGYAELQNENPEQAVLYLRKSLELDGSVANANYNLAYAYFLMGKPDEGVKYAEASFQLYDDQEYKSDAARLTGILYRNKKDYENAIKFYQASEAITPNNYYNLKALLELYIVTEDLGQAAATADALFGLEPREAELAQDVVRSYYNNDQNEELLKFFERMEKKYAKEDQVMGNLMFYKAYFYKFTNDKKKAKDCFTRARKYFKKCLEEDNDVFETIEKELKEL